MPGDRLSLDELRSVLSDPDLIREQPFSLVKMLCRFAATHEETETHEAVLRALEQLDAFGTECTSVIQGLVRETGLFPYLEPNALTPTDQFAYEFHRPLNMEAADIVFHRAQGKVYRMLLDGENVVLSAPTSFGKSLIIDAIIAAKQFRNVVIVVPTIALIDETRRRLTERFRGVYKVITHRTQNPEQKTIYVLTAERVLEFNDFGKVDFFVIDEFYKLSPENEGDTRWNLLNQAFYKLHKVATQFYMLGPHIDRLSEGFKLRVDCRFLLETCHTVVTEVHHVDPGRDPHGALVALCRELREPTIIFCGSPKGAAEVAKRLAASLPALPLSEKSVASAVEWINEHYDTRWHFPLALSHGIGVHHGRIPRALAQYVVRMFNLEALPFLVCTSTLIEGVNTKAKNIVIFDNKINRSPLDLFTFNNIKGRSGRMGYHVMGHVYLFHDAPGSGLPTVDVPIITQPSTTPTSLLIQLDPNERTPESNRRLDPFLTQELLSVETLRTNAGIDLELQIQLAREIDSKALSYHSKMNWTRAPTYDQLLTACELIWKFFNGSKVAAGSVTSSKHLAMLINKLRSAPTIALMIEEQLEFRDDPDQAVQRTLDFLRLWANFSFPRYLRALDKIQRDVFGRRDLRPGSYEWFAYRVEHFFLDPALVALDEYGIPLELARKLSSRILVPGDIDQTLSKLARLDPDQDALHPFERGLIIDAQKFL